MTRYGPGPVMHPSEVTEELLPEKGSLWQDSYTTSDRQVKVLDVRETVPQGSPVWTITCEEQFGFKRVFYMVAHGFLSRYIPVEDGNNCQSALY